MDVFLSLYFGFKRYLKVAQSNIEVQVNSPIQIYFSPCNKVFCARPIQIAVFVKKTLEKPSFSAISSSVSVICAFQVFKNTHDCKQCI